MHLSTTLNYYKRPEIQEAIAESAQNREVAVRFIGGRFGKRPDVIKYPRDVLELAKQGASSFHCSEELWSNPLQLSTDLKKKDLDSLRIGWDLVLDIDCKFLEYSKIAAELIVEALNHHDISSYSVKFSGNTGFHIAVPFGSFPKKVYNRETKDLFPDGPRRIAAYLKEMIKEPLGDRIMKYENRNFTNIIEKTKEDSKKIIYTQKNKVGVEIPYLNAEPFLHIDTILISSRHLYRMPYSLNEKSGLASIPVKPERIREFSIEDAKPENVVSELKFGKTGIENEAKKLLLNAFDSVKEEEKKKTEGEFLGSPTAVQERFFPPCIKNILKGLSDGRKRSVFILTNFLTSAGWGYDDIEALLREWNKKNSEPLREVNIVGQVKYHKRLSRKIPPPNCRKRYEELGVCAPDSFCAKIKNPANYAIKKSRMVFKEEKEK